MAAVAPAPGRADEPAGAASTLRIWHAYRGDEERALRQALERFEARNPGVHVVALAVPFEAMASKIETAVPRGHGPDVFIFVHERVGDWLERDLLAPMDEPEGVSFEPAALGALRARGRLWGLPLSLKCVALYVNAALAGDFVPRTTDDLFTLARRLRGRDGDPYALVYETNSFYFHAAWLHGYGGAILRGSRWAFTGPAAERSLALARRLVAERVVPEEANGALVGQLFGSGRAATAISGPWLAGELPPSLRYEVHPLPSVPGGRAAAPYLGVEAVMVSRRATHPRAHDLARFLVSVEGAQPRAAAGQLVATRYDHDEPPLVAAFRRQSRNAVPMPSVPAMRATWEPAQRALQRVLRGDAEPRAALDESARLFADVTRPPPARRDPTWVLVAASLLLLGLVVRFVQKARQTELVTEVRRARHAYGYVAPAALAIGVLVVGPFVVGASLSLFASQDGELYFVGAANFLDILVARGGPLLASGSFYLTLLVTVLWTAANVLLHVSIGLALALVLHQRWVALRPVWRILLILPWAVPSYITALAWKGMFHRQLGAINAMLDWLGAEPVAWFGSFSAAFTANLLTNTWLGFPFMMVVTLGALTAIPTEVLEAASVDGATPWQRFRHVTLPLLRPALAPAVLLGSVWTFNMFNVVFLVSGGEPDGTTDILVSEAYRWAFTRSAQYGYAAAYAVLIFGVLLVYTRVLGKRIGGPEGT
ncbi:MAG: extracellular solute-binding protein [Deltaproteobacteria bacterium]|nr:extracellular solute-binding protein [Deltaproteobacteria bacterium]